MRDGQDRKYDTALSRRDFLAGSAGLWIAVSIPRVGAAEAAARDEMPRALNPREWAAVEAITARILPTDDTPGALEAGCVNFIDKALATEDADALPRYRAALRELDRVRRARFEAGFVELAPERQDAVLSDLELGRLEGWRDEVASSQAFFATVRMHTIMGFVFPPRHGGNRDYVGWKTMGFPGPVHHLGGSLPEHMSGELAFVPIWERADARHGTTTSSEKGESD
jgi:gluconate 2-dehydrogenase gamma chain